MVSHSALGVIYLRRIVPKMIPPAWTHLSARPHSLHIIFDGCETDQISDTRYAGFMSPKVSPMLVEGSAVILGNLLISHRSQHQDRRPTSSFINVALRNWGGASTYQTKENIK